MSFDLFSSILEIAKARTIASGACAVGGPWAVRFPAPHRAKFFAIAKGSAWLRFDGEAAVRLEAGDVFLISSQSGTFVLATDLNATPIDATAALKAEFGTRTQLGSGEDCVFFGGVVELDAVSGGLLSDALPALIHVRAASAQAPVLRWLLDQLVQENASLLPGALLVSAQLAQLILIQLLRSHLVAAPVQSSGWLRALSDPRIAAAMRLIHREPSRAWRLAELAKAASMSRTTFAVHFKELAGVSPLVYLTAWRMRLAERELRDKKTPVSELAWSLGYTSESAFSNAFKRFTGVAPDHYRKGLSTAETVRTP